MTAHLASTVDAPADAPVDRTLVDVRLERLRWWHLPQVLELESVFGADAWSERVWWSELGQLEDRVCLVALGPDDRVAGYGVLAVVGDEADVQTLCVDPGRRGGGLGAALLVALLRAGAERGVRAVHLEVRADNAAALRLYQRTGFVAVGRRRGYYDGGTVDGVAMVLRRLPERLAAAEVS